MKNSSKYFQYGPAFQSARVEEKALPLPPDSACLAGRTLLYLSDIHLSSRFPRRALDRLLSQIESLHPDLILLGGDYAESLAWQKEFFRLIGGLSAPLGTYAVAGNNDCECFGWNMQLMKETAGEHGVSLLIDQTVRLAGGRLVIAGLDEYKQAAPLTSPLFSEKDHSAFRILLSHYPQSVSVYLSRGFGLQPHLSLAGHTHGGQFRLLGLTPYSIGFEYRLKGVHLPAIRGWRPMGDGQLLVSAGLGTSRLPFRLGVPPEIHLLRFTL